MNVYKTQKADGRRATDQIKSNDQVCSYFSISFIILSFNLIIKRTKERNYLK